MTDYDDWKTDDGEKFFSGELDPEENLLEEEDLGDSTANLCRGCQSPTEYQYCEPCTRVVKCAHGVVLEDGCNQCDIEGDLAFDAAREGR